MDRCSLAISEVVERETCKTLLSSTNIVFPGTANVSRADLAATDIFDTATALAITVQLRSRGGVPFEGGLYGGVLQPQHEGDLNATNATFQNASPTSHRVRKLEYAEIGIWAGVQWVRGNFMPIFVGTAAPGAAAPTAILGQVTVAGTGGTLAAGTYLAAIVARELVSDYERRISQASAGLVVATSTGSVTFVTPTSANYTYDLYLSQAGGTVLYKVRSRVAPNTTVVVTAAPTGTESVKPVAPAAGISTFPGWVFAKDAFTRVELNQMSMQSYVTPAGASWSNPLSQGRKVGSKFMFKVAKLDDNFIVMFETGSSFPDYLPA